ncbi:EscU/YscU/HrcU family type III secretion system export apparatus switch protein [Megalodesulfovibrio paquesii]
MPQQDPSRTEQATPKRVNKAREKGSVAKSQEISKLTTILAGYIALRVYASYIWDELQVVFQWFFSGFATFELSAQNVHSMVIKVGWELAIMILPVIIFIGLVAWITMRVQVGPLWAPKVFEMKFDRMLNVVAGLKRIFVDTQTLIRLGKSLLQSVVIGFSIYLGAGGFHAPPAAPVLPGA